MNNYELKYLNKFIRGNKNSFIAIVLLFFLVVETIFAPAQVFAAGGGKNEMKNANNKGSYEGVIDVGGIKYKEIQNLEDNGDGTYTLTYKLESNMSESNSNTDKNASKNDYFTALQPGKYLVELWGGSGYQGQDSKYGNGGAGGAGGHVYGVVNMEQGETLAYALGGNGSESISTDMGGGANGPGGNHGNIGSFKIGGGGGYSYVLKFAPGEYEKKYLDSNGVVTKNIDDADRTSKYIMIAGGGGGGGAGNGISFKNQNGIPFGGAGGSIGSNSGNLSGAGYDVEGTYFAGGNGQSSSYDFSYVGHGGTDVPGKTIHTLLLFGSDAGNDWKGVNVPTLEGGAGGAGNLRGGAGGGGFCGGSGGIMRSLIEPVDVGGGGGGSSFIAKDVNYHLSSTEQQQLIGTNSSQTGGAVHITYLGSKDSATKPEPEKSSLSIDGNVSKYFDIQSFKSSSGNASTSNGSFQLTDGVFKKPTEQSKKSEIKLELIIKPKAGFAGGNGVPIGDKINVSVGKDKIATNINGKCNTVNVPLDFQVVANSYTTNDATQTYKGHDLYVDNYESIRGNISKDWRYDFIESIGPYQVEDKATGQFVQPNETITADKTRNYDVSFTVTPKAEPKPSQIGAPVVKKTFSKAAAIVLAKAGEDSLGDNSKIKYTKMLNYNTGTKQYELSLDANIQYNTLNTEYNFSTNSNSNRTFNVPMTGYYMIQAWGAKGGTGVNGTTINPSDAGKGGIGGNGGLVSGYIKLNAGQGVTINVGNNGEDGVDIPRFYSGRGGGFTKITLGDNTTLMIAGGGGGGASASVNVDGDNGKPGQIEVSDTYLSKQKETYEGKTGNYFIGSSGKGGAAGKNYMNESMSNDTFQLSQRLSQSAQNIYKNRETTNPNPTGAGAAKITCMELTEPDELKSAVEKKLVGYQVDTNISKYFSVVTGGIKLEDGKIKPTITAGANQANQPTNVNVASINPTVNKTLTGTDMEKADANLDTSKGFVASSYGHFKLTIPLTPKDGFLGGNDVPVLDYNSGTGMKITQQGSPGQVNVKKQTPQDTNKSDYANVEIKYTPDLTQLQTKNVYYIKGDQPIAHSDLYTYQNTKQYTWEADYVNLIDPTNVTTTYAPEEKTTVPIEIGVKPKTAVPTLANVIGPVEGKTASKEATIDVYCQVIYNLTNMSTSATPNYQDKYVIVPGQDYNTRLSVGAKMELPKTITVKVGGQTLDSSKYSYDSSTGKLFIPGKHITSNVEIIGVAVVPEKYSIHYVYQTEPNGTSTEKVEEYKPGTDISKGKFSDTYKPTAYRGYEFNWDWNITEGPTEMPTRDLWITGTYEPKEYNVTIRYVDENGENVADQYDTIIHYGTDYEFQIPVVNGYIPVDGQYIIKGKIDENTPETGLEITVKYKQILNQLNIYYIYDDTKEIIGEVHKELQPGAEYNVPTEFNVDGYTPDKPAVTGKMPTEGGVVEYVYYKPNQYNVTFDSQGGICSETSISVTYNNVYGYDKENSPTRALPVPVKPGYTFDGWYIGNQLIKEDTKVTTASDHQLTAKWTANQYTLKINYQYETGLPVKGEFPNPHEEKVEVGGTYNVASPKIKGYTAEPLIVTGKMPAQNVTENVIYYKDSYKLTIHYVDEAGNTVAKDHIGYIKRETPYEVVSPDVLGHTPKTPIVKGSKMDEDFETTVVYTKNQYTLTINYKLSGEDPNPPEVPKPVVKKVMYDENYSVQSPTVKGYYVDIQTVSGTMGAGDLTVDVTYSKEEPPETIKVNVDWGNLSFDVTRTGWNPSTHTYSGGTISPAVPNTNYLTVTNYSNINIAASVTSQIDQTYSEFFKGYYTGTNNQADTEITSASLNKVSETTDSKKLWFWLKEPVQNNLKEINDNLSAVVGNCTVTINRE